MTEDVKTTPYPMFPETLPDEATAHAPVAAEGALSRAAAYLMRFGLVVVIGWIGAMKFTAYEAEGISGLVANSPLLSWVYSLLSVRAFSAVLGVVEIAIAVMIAAGLLWPRIGLIGSTAALAMFATTLSFILTTPGAFEPSAGGFPALSVAPGQFLIKDLPLLGIALWLVAGSWENRHSSLN